MYLFIVLVYLLRLGVNGIIPVYPIDAKGVFFAWLILSIFILDWAKSALAGFEASALMKRTFAPSSAKQLMWHADRGWGSVSGWWKAMVAVYTYLRHKLDRKDSVPEWEGPSYLWWYLSFSSFLLYVAIPLAGLSMDTNDALKLTNRNITILGSSQVTFDIRSSNAVAELTSSRWRQGNPTSPQGDTIFYAPEGTKDVSSTYYDDHIQAISHDLEIDSSIPASSILFFSGPEVSERAHGRAWGLLTNLSCSVANPYTGLELIKVKSINDWRSPFGSSDEYGTNYTTALQGLQYTGLTPLLFYVDQSFGISYQYVMASDREVEGGSDYVNSSTLPLAGSLELVMWQSYQGHYTPDAVFTNLSSHPSVVSSVSPIDNATYLGYGIRCASVSDVGFADLDAATRTYSKFTSAPALQAFSSDIGDIRLNQYPGILAIESLVFAAFTTATLEYEGPPVCMPGASVTCSPWYGANVATNGVPIFVTSPPSSRAGDLQYPTISPERMNLAIYKLFGEAAIAMMASGPGNWTGSLQGTESSNDLIPGKVPWQVVLTLLSVWTIVTVLPNCWTLAEKRWAATLDGFEMFRLGAEWREVVWKFEGSEPRENKILAEVPGMIGDMEPAEERGFIGLSRSTASVEDRSYSNNRAALSD
jgi:hypothetical protein